MASSSDSTTDDHTLQQYASLKERAQQLFDGLRNLPAFGQRLWESYFRRTFDAYNGLWKFQQEHRQVLELRGGLRRYQIGETASRIGQLYYHFYLRKGDSCYLDEAYVFYEFIRRRRYFATDAQGEAPPAGSPEEALQRHSLALRQLRYYTRFVVVCFLLEKRGMLRPLLAEFKELVQRATPHCAPRERAEWQLVLSELDG